MIFEKLRQVVAANADWPLNMSGQELSLVEGTYPVTIELRKNGTVIGQASGVMPGDYIRGMDFDYFRIINGANPQVLGVMVSSGSAGSNRVAGEVSVISGEAVRSFAGVSFWGGAAKGANAGNYSYAQLWNPASSGVNLVINQIMVSLGAAGGGLQIRSGVPRLTTAYGVPYALPKKLGGVASLAENRTDALGTPVGTLLSACYVQANDTIGLKMTEPIIIVPGDGITLSPDVVNAYILAIFQFYQVAV